MCDLSGHTTEYYNGTWARSELYAGGMRLATYIGGETAFVYSDWLGSHRTYADQTGAAFEPCTNLPFGDGMSCNSPQWDTELFTGDEHDAASNTEHTDFRQLSGTQGRWLSPDPYDGSMDITNPQSLNRYAYVGNDPINSTDPTGLVDSGGCGTDDGPLMCYENTGTGLDGVNILLGGGGGRPIDNCANPFITDASCSHPAPVDGGVFVGIGLGNGESFGGSGILPGDEVNLPQIPLGQTLLDLLGIQLPDPQCDFGPCGGFVGSSSVTRRTHRKQYRWIPDWQLWGTHWCGPGGAGTIMNQTDEACFIHDKCYERAGVDAAHARNGRLTPAQQTAVLNCNQDLCNALSNTIPSPMAPLEWINRSAIWTTFRFFQKPSCH